jgi:acyl-CoA thioesterase
MTSDSLHPNPEETARLAASAMWASDRASQSLGMEVLEVGPSAATLALTAGEAMTNGHDIVHGGFIFALAYSAFACNSYGDVAVAAHCSIAFIRPGRRGDRLVAKAREISRSGRSGIYDVQVSVDGAIIAEFRGHPRIVGGSFLNTADDAPRSRER